MNNVLDWKVEMAKNTSSSAFRRVDVDQYTEGKYEEDALTDDGVNGPNDMEIQTMLAQYPLILMQIIQVSVYV